MEIKIVIYRFSYNFNAVTLKFEVNLNQFEVNLAPNLKISTNLKIGRMPRIFKISKKIKQN